jgi:hypothetical protein
VYHPDGARRSGIHDSLRRGQHRHPIVRTGSSRRLSTRVGGDAGQP